MIRTKHLAWAIAATALASCQAEEPVNAAPADNAKIAENVAEADADCGPVSSHVEIIACHDRIAAASRAEMLKMLEVNRRNARTYDALPINKEHQDFVKNLDASQAAWEGYAKAQCDFEAHKNAGSGGYELLADCQDRLNRQRAAELNQALAWDGERSDIDVGKKP